MPHCWTCRSSTSARRVPGARLSRWHRFFARLRDEFQPMADKRGLRLVVMPCAQAVRSDPVYLKRILQNLVSNALRYTRTGRVLLGARRCGANLRLEVWDTGPGIPPDRAGRDLSREFTRLTRHSNGDRGFGLADC